MKRITSLTALTLCILATSASGAATPRPPHTLPADPEADNSYFAEICAIGAGGSGGGGTSPSPRQSPGSPVKTIPTPRSRMGTPAVCILPTIPEYDIAAAREHDVNLNLTLARIQLCNQMINEISDFITIANSKLNKVIAKLTAHPDTTRLYQRMQSLHHQQTKKDIGTIIAARTALKSATSHSVINIQLESAKKAFDNARELASNYCQNYSGIAEELERKGVPGFKQALEKIFNNHVPRIGNTVDTPYKLAQKDIEDEFSSLDISEEDLHPFDDEHDIVDNGLADLNDYANQVSAAITSLFGLLAEPYLPRGVSVHWPVVARIMPLLKTHAPLALKRIVETIWTNKTKTRNEKVNLFHAMSPRIEPVGFKIICDTKTHMKITAPHKKDLPMIRKAIDDIFNFFAEITVAEETRSLLVTLIKLGSAKNTLDTQVTEPAKLQYEILDAIQLFDVAYTENKESIKMLVASALTENPARGALWYEYTAHDGTTHTHSAKYLKQLPTQAEIADKCRFIETTIEACTKAFRVARHKTARAARHLGAGAGADD